MSINVLNLGNAVFSLSKIKHPYPFLGGSCATVHSSFMVIFRLALQAVLSRLSADDLIQMGFEIVFLH